MGMTDEERRQLDERHGAFSDRLRALDPDLWREWDELEGDVRREERLDALDHLVVGLHDPDGGFPFIEAAVSTRGAAPVVIDECCHRPATWAGAVTDED
jgi:hypothetical protein